MPPRSPLPARHGLSAAWVRSPSLVEQRPQRASSRPQQEGQGGDQGLWPTMGAWLESRLGERTDVTTMLTEARFVYDDLRPVAKEDPYTPHTFVWFHRDLRDEVEVPVAAGTYPDVPAAAGSMAKVRKDVHLPDEARARVYDRLFAVYLELYDHFGREHDGMRRLAALRREVLRTATRR